MRRLEIPDAPSAVIGLSAPDDAAVLRPADGLLSVQTVDFFRSFVSDPYIFGRIAANHALGDIYAMGATPRTALAIAMLPHAADEKTEADLFLMLRGSLDTFAKAGVSLVGGHTAEGAEMALGFTVNGEINEASIKRKSGARPGDSLILTKPLGTGIILAGEMRGKARGRWHAAAVEAMLQSSAEAAACLTRHDAHAVTDVTGFGLAGHLLEMLEASGAAAELVLNDVPLLDGALELASEGIESSMAPANAASRRQAAATAGSATATRFAVLNDPQTAGGLLAAVPEGRARACIDELHRRGYAHASIIGRVIGEENGVPRLKFATLDKR
jgi:selenide,water dikinase